MSVQSSVHPAVDHQRHWQLEQPVGAVKSSHCPAR